MPLQLIPFSTGLRGDIDPRLLPDGSLADAVNVEMDRDGRLAGRARYQAIATTVYGTGTFVAYDLFSVGDRLFAFGDRNAKGYPTDVFEYISSSAAAAAWSPSDHATGSTVTAHRLPRATRLREIARPPDSSGGVSDFSVAALLGFVMLVYNNDDPDGVAAGYAHLIRAVNDQTMFFREIPSGEGLKQKVVALSDRFLIFGLVSGLAVLRIYRCIPASDESVTGTLATAYTGLGVISIYEVVKVTGSDEVVAVANCAGTVIVRRFNNVGTLQVPSGGAYANITAAATRIAVEASSSANQITIALVIAGVAKMYSYNLSTGATLQTAISVSGVTMTEVSIVRTLPDRVEVFVSMDDANPEDSIQYVQWTPSSGVFGTPQRLPDSKLQSTVVYQGGEFVLACRYGSTVPTQGTNVLVSLGNEDGGGGAAYSQLLAVKDLEVASPPGVHLPEIALDASTGKYYWANAVLNPDQDGSPVVTEFSLGATERRQAAVHGNHVYISGGLPCVYDLRYLCESGYTERPRIVSLTAGTGGSLLGGATYHYRVHEEQVDSQGDLHLSPPSTIVDITLSSSQSKVTAVVSTGHGPRRNAAAAYEGISVRHVLSRSLATATLTAAILVGTASINPPSSALNTLTLKLTAGGSAFTVTFSGSATTQAVVLSEINAVVSSEVTASAPNGILVLTSVDTGDGATIQITNGTANTILGLTEGDAATGETERTIGENFQRAASAYNPTADIPGEFISIVDTRKDQTDPTILDSDLIRQGVLYSQGIASGAHHAPPPSDYVWAGRERLIWSGQNKRSRFTATKLIVPGEPAECAAEGFIAFSGQVSGDIEAGCVLGDGIALFTRTQVWIVTGAGPNRAGQGEFFAAQCVSRKLGIKADGWRSLLEDDNGVWFQGADSQLYHLSRGGEVAWKGKAIREYLASYPVIVAAVARTQKQELAFAVTNTLGTTGGILRYRPDIDAWFFDDVGAVSALSEFQGRLAYIQAGIVYLQDAAPGSGTGPDYYVSTGMFQGFQALGFGAVNELGFLGTFRGNCTVTIHESVDGVSFGSAIASWALSSSKYSVNERVTLLKPPALQVRDSMALRYKVSAMSASEGVWLHAIALDTTLAPRMSRQGPAHVL